MRCPSSITILVVILLLSAVFGIQQKQEASSLDLNCEGDAHVRVKELRSWMRQPKIALETRRKIHVALKYLNEVCLWVENNNDLKVTRRAGVLAQH